MLEVAHATFTNIFSGLEERYAKQLAVVREQYASEVRGWAVWKGGHR